jgi:hypothetical protein
MISPFYAVPLFLYAVPCFTNLISFAIGLFYTAGDKKFLDFDGFIERPRYCRNCGQQISLQQHTMPIKPNRSG